MNVEDRITGDAETCYNNAPHHIRKDIRDCLEDNPRMRIDSKEEFLDAYLVWNGIIGYTTGIMNVFEVIEQV